MNKILQERSENKCELCGSSEGLSILTVKHAPANIPEEATQAVVCTTCKTQLENPSQADPNHWRCLNDSIWSEIPAIKILTYKQLIKLKSHGWPSDLLEMMYLEEEYQQWADATLEEDPIHVDSNGNTLQNGDTVILIKDLDVKGSNITAKRGTAVRNIRLDPNNTEYIEGKVGGQQIVILTKYTKK